MHPMTLRSGALELFQATIDPKSKISESNPLLGARSNSQLIKAFAGKAPAGPHAPEFNRALANVDFQNLLGDMLSSSLNSPLKFKPTHTEFTDTRFVPNFLDSGLVELNSFSLLEKPEGTEYRHAILDGSYTIAILRTFARALEITKEAYAADNIGILDRIITNVRLEVKRLEADLVYGIMAENPAGPDGKNFWSAEHTNVVAAAPVSVASLSEATVLLKNQLNADGDHLNTAPTLLLAGNENQYEIEQLFATMGQTTIRRIYEPRIRDNEWYLSSDDPFASVVKLAGSTEDVSVKLDKRWSTDGIRLNVRADRSAALTNWKTVVRCR